MPDYGDIRQRTILAIESQGADALTTISDGIAQLQREQNGLIDGYAKADSAARAAAGGAAAYIKELTALEAEIAKLKGMYDEAGNSFDKMSDLQKKLGEMQKRSEAETREAIAATAAARRTGTQAVADHIVKTREEIAQIEAARVADIEAMGQRARAHAQFERQVDQALAEERASWVQTTAATRQQIQALKDMGVIQTQVTAKAGAAATTNKAYNSSLMSVAYALDDVRYGFGAIVNNIPMLAMAAGATAQWAAGIAIAGIGVYELGKALEPVVSKFLKDFVLPPKLFEDIDSLEVKLKELDGIKIKTEVDYIDISNARRELMRLKEEESSYNRLKGQKTQEQEKRGKVVSEAIVESGGGDDYTSSVENITQAIVDKMAADSPEVQSQKAYIAERMARVGNRNIPLAIQARAEREAEAARDRLDDHMKGIRETAVGITGGATAGRSLESGQLAAFVAANEGTLEARGVDTMRLGAGLENAQKGNLFADEKRKMADRNAKEARAAKDKRDAKDEEVNSTVEEIQRWTSQAPLKDRADKDKRVADAEAEAADLVRSIDHERMTARQKRVTEGAGRFGPGVDEALEQARLGHAAGGMGADASAARLQPQLVARLKGNGVPADIVDDVAKQILAKALDKVANQIQEETMKRGVTTPQAAAMIRQVAQEKFAAGDMANQRRGEAPQRQATQQQSQQQRAYMAQLKTQALMESTMGIVGPAMQELSQIEAMNQMLQSKVRGMSKMQQRGGMQNRTFVPNFGG